MSISYSGITNFGKVTLPSVESWNMNANIMRDPPRSVMTRKIDKVQDTSEILATLAASDDRFCDAINYYARGQNPMVSVSYGEAQTAQNTSAAGQAYLPYRIIRDGAFRPPVWTPTDLLPLSRLPRNWTTVDPRPFQVDYSKQADICGVPNTSNEIREDKIRAGCETRKTISAYPELTRPLPKYMLKNPTAATTVETNPSSDCHVPANYDPKPRKRNYPGVVSASARRVMLNSDDTVKTNDSKSLKRNYPLHSSTTNYSNTERAAFRTPLDQSYDRLKHTNVLGSFAGRPTIPVAY